MIQLAINDNQIDVVAADEARVDAGNDSNSEERKRSIILAIKQILAKGEFHGRNVVSCLPDDRLKITSLRLAEAGTVQIKQALDKEATHRFGLDPANDAIHYLVAGSVRQGDEIKNELILFATDDETIRSHIAMLEEAQLRPVAIDTIPCALFKCFERSLRRQEDKERTVVFVDVGSRFTTVVFGRGGEICFVKQINIGGERLNQEIATKLNINFNEVQMLRGRLRMAKEPSSPQTNSTKQASKSTRQWLNASTQQVMIDAINKIAEELARELSLCFRYYTVTFRGRRVEKAVFSGGEAYENILLDYLRQQLKIEIEVAQPLRGFNMGNIKFDDRKQDSLCEWSVAVGLSLKGWTEENGTEKEIPQVQEVNL